MKTLFWLGGLLCGLRLRWVSVVRHGMLRGRVVLRCPVVYSSLWLTALTLPVWWQVGDTTVLGWAAIMATQLRWRGGHKGLWVALRGNTEPCQHQ